MRNANKRHEATAGLTLVELLVMTAIVCLLALVFLPVIGNALATANMAAMGTRGRVIHVAIACATIEREELGQPTAWPSDEPGSDTSFDNSTDYFRYLLDEERLDTPAWKPVVTGLDHSRLAGAGVPACTNNRLTAACNVWTVAKNVGSDMDESMPVLITRNVDASSLASLTTVTNRHWTLRPDTTYNMPFRDRGLLLIRKNGAIRKIREPLGMLTYQTVYGTPTLREDAENFARTRPLQYLTPRATVTPGEAAYRTALAHHVKDDNVYVLRMKKEFTEITKWILPISIFWCVVYLTGAIKIIVSKKAKGNPVTVSAYHVILLCLHFAAVVLYSAFTGLYLHARMMDRFFPVYVLALAIVTQLVSVLLVAVTQRGNRTTCLQEMKWMLSALLFVGGAWIVLAVVGLMVGLMFG